MTHSSSGKGWIISIVIAVLSLLASAFVEYSHNDKELAVRITTTEVQQKNDDNRLERIENKVDKLDDKIDRLLSRSK